ncbi:MAG: flagellar hook-length control protein FliK [Deltaproteobacteria bacterium]|nr:flagellar hook-length control protein FliK [Deltaproteobacteria bacterium]
MNVDLVRALDPRNVDPAPGARAGKSGSGFPELMDSMLGGAADERSAPRPRAEQEPPRSTPTREARAEREPRADRAPRPERSERGTRGEAREASRDEADEAPERAVEAKPRASAPATLPGRRPTGPRKGGTENVEAGAEAAAEAQSATIAAASVATIGIPELIALVSAPVEGAEEMLEDGASEESASTEVAAGRLVDALAAASGVGGEGGAAVAGAADPAATTDAGSEARARNPIVEPGRAPTGDATLDVAHDGEPAQQIAADPATEGTPGGAAGAQAQSVEVARVRPGDVRAEAPRRDAEGPVADAGEPAVRPELSAPQTRGGHEGFADERPRDPQAGLAPTVAAERGESASAGAAAPATAPAMDSAQAPNETLDASGRPQDVAAQARVEGMSLAPTTRAPEPLSPMQTGRPMPASAPDSIAVQADWLANRGGGTARLVLHPPELGEIAIRVTVRNQSVDVVMVAQTALAHQVAEDQSERLSQAFASRDLRLDQFEVRRGDPSDASSTGQFGSSDAGARERERAEQEAQIDRGGAGQGGRRRGAAGLEAVVAPPRIASNGRAAGIDLRI